MEGRITDKEMKEILQRCLEMELMFYCQMALLEPFKEAFEVNNENINM